MTVNTDWLLSRILRLLEERLPDPDTTHKNRIDSDAKIQADVLTMDKVQAESGRIYVLDSTQVVVDMLPPWTMSTPEDWRKEAKTLREQRPDAKAAAELCERFATALERNRL